MIHIPEIDQEIALHAKLPDLMSLQQCNHYYNTLLSNEGFWRAKVQKDYKVAQYKPAHESYSEQYMRLWDSKGDLPLIVMLGCLDELIVHWNGDDSSYEITTEEGPIEEFNLADLAFYYQQYAVMDYLGSHGVQLNTRMVEYAARDGLLDVLKWFARNGVLPSFYGMDLAIHNNYTDVVQWICQQNIYPSNQGLEYALEHNLHEILGLLAVNQH